MAVKNGDTVRVHYKGSLADGTLFDSSEGREPLEFVFGAGDIIPGFEAAVSVLEPGESVVVTIDPENGYGPRMDQLVHTVSKGDFGEEPFVGGMVALVSPEGQEMPGQIVSIEGDDVTIDFNHPLAGQALTFEVTLVEVDEA